MSDDEIIDNLHREIAHLQTNLVRLENENIALESRLRDARQAYMNGYTQGEMERIALATANSELRSKYLAFRQAVEEAAGLRWHDDRDQAIDVALNTYD